MSRKRYSEEQIIKILKLADEGMPVTELCRTYGMSNASYYKWKAKYGGMDVNEAKRLRVLEEENRRLKQVVADLTLDNLILKDISTKKF